MPEHHTPTSALRVVFLGSGSGGNATAVTDGSTTLLIDCGFSAREVARRLACAGVDASSVDAILVTHEHSDHLRGVRVFAKRHSTAVFGTPGTFARGGVAEYGCDCETVATGDTFRIGSLEVLAFATSHDAAEPVGYRVQAGTSSYGAVTDTGVFTAEAAEALAGCELLGLESNHDLQMLEDGPYPWVLKRRIRSEHGHLSNEDAADVLERLAHDGLRRVFGLHRSRTNNTADLARQALAERLARIGLELPIEVPAQDLVHDTCTDEIR